MSSPRRSDEELLSLAREVLDLPPSSTNLNSNVPSPFLAELKRHISIFPDDTKFYIIRQPGTGFGLAICQEDGCNNFVIHLSRNKDADGGKSIGIGSLNEYRAHVHEHPTHKLSRRARIQGSRPNRNITFNNSNSSSYSSSPANTTHSRLTLLSVQDNDMSPRPLSVTASRPTASRPAPERIFGSINRDTVSASSRLSNVDAAPGSRMPMLRHRFSLNETSGSAASLNTIGSSSSRSSSSRRPTISMRAEDSSKRVGPEMMKTPLSPHDNNRTSGMSLVASTPTSSSMSRLPLIEANTPSGLEMTESQGASSSTYQPLAISALPQTQMVVDYMHDVIDYVSDASSGIFITETFDHELDEDEDDEYDALGNWRGRGEVFFRGPIAEVGDLQKFFQDAGNAEQFDDNASIAKGLQRLGLPNLNTHFPNLTITLMPHQVIGVAWMLDKELGVNRGGILSDEMGLGKTVQMIATMVANPSRDPAVKTTLIVAPLALLGQWKLEIETKTNDGLSVLIYHGPGKTKNKKELQKYDVVLTTFSTLALEWPDYEAEKKKKKKKTRKRGADFIATDSEEDRIVEKKKLGILFNTNWYRVVLDEAQNIRNKRTRVSRAITEVIATYRWCLTGTPITNSLGDAYPLIRFLRIRPWCDWNEFNEHIAKLEKKRPNHATRKLQAIFATCLLRRKKDTLLDGKRLVELPVKDVHLHKLEFTQDERDIYQMVETRSQQVFNRYLRAGTVLKNYAHVLVMLLRLRQICSHTSLITEQDGVIIDENLEHSTEDKRDELIVAQTKLGREFVNRLRTKLKDIALERIAAELQSAEAAVENEECPICYDVFTDAVVTPCMHFFCRECINNVLAAPQTMDVEHPVRDERPCPSCRTPISKDKLFSREVFEPTDKELNLAKSEPKTEEEPRALIKAGSDEDDEMPDIGKLLSAQGGKSRQSKGKGRAKVGLKRTHKRRQILDEDEEDCRSKDEDDDLSDFIVDSDEDEEEKDARRAIKNRLGKRRASSPVDYEESDDDSVIIGRKRPRMASVDNDPIKVLSRMLPSTKMMRMMESLLKWAEEHPDEKTMIISQWTQCLELVSNYLTSKGIGHVRFQGNMSREKRDKAISTFMKKNDAKVLLMSLKCGGVGLNLTRANRVISLDLGWSEAVESQAFDRVHRLGQTRPVVVERLVIKNTVEDRVLALQEKKKNLADGSLGEGNGKKIGRLTVRELANLFGLDHRGQLLLEN